MKYILVMIFGFLVFCGGVAKAQVFNAEHFTLDNGMEVMVIANNRAPVVTHMVWYRVGAGEEPTGQSGIAHFLEHLMFKGSDGLEPGEFSRIIRNLGGNDNAFTSYDFTAYFQSVAVEHLEQVMRMEAGRMRGLLPPLEEVESERSVILEERNQRVDNDPRARFDEQLRAALFPNHPYARPVLGWRHEMENLDWDIAKTFYDRWYAPNNALLVVSGDVTGPQVLALAQDIYGLLERRDIPDRDRSQSPVFEGQGDYQLRNADINQISLIRLYTVPSYRQDKEMSLAMQILERVMADGPTSRLYQSLVVDQKLAVNVSLFYSPFAWDEAMVSIYATPADGVSPDQLNAAIDKEIRALIVDGITEEELVLAQDRAENDSIFARDSLSGPAMILGRAWAVGYALDDIEQWPEQIRAVTAEQVQKAARLYLHPDEKGKGRRITGTLLPKEHTDEYEKVIPEAQPEETDL